MVANVGDADAVLSRNGVPLLLTTKHTPKNPKVRQEERMWPSFFLTLSPFSKEHLRVENEGGVVAKQRLFHPLWNGDMVNLGITRSIGDAYFKLGKYTDGKPSGLTAEPDIAEVSLKQGDEFLILASDGLWDVISPDEAVNFVRNMIRGIKSEQDLTFVCKQLTEMAIIRGSKDNCTVLVVSFHALAVEKEKVGAVGEVESTPGPASSKKKARDEGDEESPQGVNPATNNNNNTSSVAENRFNNAALGGLRNGSTQSVVMNTSLDSQDDAKKRRRVEDLDDDKNGSKK